MCRDILSSILIEQLQKMRFGQSLSPESMLLNTILCRGILLLLLLSVFKPALGEARTG